MDDFHLQFTNKASCKRLCLMWRYPKLSTSYNPIVYRKNQKINPNISWSRVRIRMLEKLPMIRTEEPRTSKYLIICDIGGMIGLYVGFSMITAAEILFYSFNY